MTGICIVPGTRVWDRKIVSIKLGWVLIAESLFLLIISIEEFALVAFSISIVFFARRGKKFGQKCTSLLHTYILVKNKHIAVLQFEKIDLNKSSIGILPEGAKLCLI